MSLQLILGSSGVGKSHHLYETIIKDSIVNSDTNYLMVVPEQFTMQTQRDMVAAHPNHGIMNIDILSFMRLAYRVFDELGGQDKVVLEDTGKSMILRKVVEQKKGELHLFQSNVKKQGFIGELKSMLSEVYQYSIGVDQLQNIIEELSNRPMLQNKLQDILTIYKGFQEYIEEKYITTEEILDVLYDKVEQSSFVKDSVICLDGFTGFTPSQTKLLTKLLRLCKKVYVTVTIDEREQSVADEEYQLFHLSKKTIASLQEIAISEQVPIDKPIWVRPLKGGVPYRFKDSPGLAALEKNLFRYPRVAYNHEVEDISIHIAMNPAEEITFTTQQIKRLIKEGYRYKDIAVVSGDISTYGRIIENIYEQEGIPFFIDNKKGILGNPAVELIRSVLEVIIRDFSYESMFRYLRCELVDVSKEEVDILENYALAMGIRGYGLWNKDWDRTYKSRGPIDFIQINEARRNALEGLEDLRSVVKNKEATVKEISIAICTFLIQKRVGEKLLEYVKKFDELGRLSLAKEYKQVYPMIMELFEKMVELLGDEVIGIDEYSKLLDTGFEEIKVGIIPPSIDQIVVGDIERTRLKDIKALFFLGVNDGLIPKSSDSGGIISDMEREILLEHEVELAPTKRQKSFTEQFYLYLNLTKPTKHLYVTYSKVGTDGKSKKASYLISKLRQIFPKLKIQDCDEYKTELSYILATKQGIEYLVEQIRRYSESSTVEDTFFKDNALFQELYSWYCSDEKRRGVLEQVIEGAFYENEENSLPKAVAKALYGNQLSGSVTRLERYAACAFAHFVSYGLRLLERQEYRLAVPDIGNIFHKAIDIFSNKVKKSEYHWYSIPDDVRDQFATEAVEEAAVGYGNQVILSSKRNAYMLERVMRITKRTIWALCSQVKKGKFEPEGFELQFSFLDDLESVNVELSEDSKIQLQGRIDRIDVYEEPEKNRLLVKVIDYKSGHSALDMGQVFYGLQLQLAVYLSATMELKQKQNPNVTVEPAGVFYYNIDDPIVDKTPDVEQAILKELRMTGLVNDDMQVTKYLDTSFMGEDGKINGSVKSTVIPVETNKEGYPTKRSAIASSKQFKEMTEYVNHKIVEIGQEILNGQAEVNPYKLGDRTACDYCSFQGICGFDVKLPGNRYHQLKKLEKEDVFGRMECMFREEEE